MVGVPGKYKGCETCRRRRVKCSNERPFCKKCVNSGRECEGYERERVFITGTLDTKGRVASHPKKGVTGNLVAGKDEKRWRRSSSRSEASSPPGLAPSAPLTSAWEDHITFSDHGNEYNTMVTALQTRLQDVVREPVKDAHLGEDPVFKVSLPPYAMYELHPSEEPQEFNCEAQCLTSFGVDRDSTREMADPQCVFLYEHNLGAAATWMVDDRTQASAVRSLGPKHFRSFPNHHFFARVYRPTALSLALLSRKETFLAIPEWTTVPWQQHPKSLMDQLIDVALFLPSLLAQSDEILTEPPTIPRRNRAKELLQHCLAVERQFDQWLVQAIQGTASHAMSYWPEDPDGASTLPFAYAWTFKDSLTGAMFMYYWMSQILLRRCVSSVHHAIFETAIDVYPDTWPPLLPAEMQIDITRYHQIRELGANICRGLDAVLEATMQPDLLLGPLRVASDMFQEINAASQDAVLEVMWLEAFGDRLKAKGQQVANTVEAHRWSEVARF